MIVPWAGLLLSIAVMSGGCAFFGLAAHAVIPEKIEAQYEPPKTPMLVLVENQANPEMLVAESEQLAKFIIDDLVTYEVAPIVDTKKLQQLRDTEPQMQKLTISEIGRRLGAKQVLYVNVVRMSVGEIEGVPLHGKIETLVHMVDVDSGRTKFPSMGESWPVGYETPLTRDYSKAGPASVREGLLRTAGTTIGRLFHDYEPGA